MATRTVIRSLFVLALAGSLFGVGCHVSDYPIITDDRGDYSGIVRTGHKAYITPSFTAATIWADGSDETFTMVYQNQYGDQKLYSFNNFDPTACVLYLDQTYCDWRYDGCPAATSWNPVQNDEIFDLEQDFYDFDCSGARSLCVWIAMEARIGECGDGAFRHDVQAFFREFSLLESTSWRGERAYVLPLHAGNTDLTLVATDGSRWSAPVFGTTTGIVTDRLQLALPMTPNTRHTINWARQWAADHGSRATAEIRYGGIEADIEISLAREGLAYNASRF